MVEQKYNVWFDDFPVGCENCGEIDHVFNECPDKIPAPPSITITLKKPSSKLLAGEDEVGWTRMGSEKGQSSKTPANPHGHKPYLSENARIAIIYESDGSSDREITKNAEKVKEETFQSESNRGTTWDNYLDYCLLCDFSMNNVINGSENICTEHMEKLWSLFVYVDTLRVLNNYSAIPWKFVTLVHAIRLLLIFCEQYPELWSNSCLGRSLHNYKWYPDQLNGGFVNEMDPDVNQFADICSPCLELILQTTFDLSTIITNNMNFVGEETIPQVHVIVEEKNNEDNNSIQTPLFPTYETEEVAINMDEYITIPPNDEALGGGLECPPLEVVNQMLVNNEIIFEEAIPENNIPLDVEEDEDPSEVEEDDPEEMVFADDLEAFLVETEEENYVHNGSGNSFHSTHQSMFSSSSMANHLGGLDMNINQISKSNPSKRKINDGDEDTASSNLMGSKKPRL